MPRSRSRNVVSVRSAKSARGMFSTGTKAALGAGEVCGGGVTPSAVTPGGVTPGEVSPRPPTVPGEVAKPHLGQEMGQGQCRDSGVQVTGLVAHHHMDLLVLLDVILQRWRHQSQQQGGPILKNTQTAPLSSSSVPGATHHSCHP